MAVFGGQYCHDWCNRFLFTKVIDENRRCYFYYCISVYCGGGNHRTIFMYHWCCSYESLVLKICKKTLRNKIYSKLLRLGSSYNSKVSTSEVVQMSVEGVDQLDIYFASYLPQFFLQHDCSYYLIRSAMLYQLAVSIDFVRVCSAHSNFHCSGTNICKKTVI